ncbi:MAG: hypothetical protein M0Z85_03100 [Gammaproteobacteria bacterium]|nr:hypothetical protein [Gammaproteobacteria bacterium]
MSSAIDRSKTLDGFLDTVVLNDLDRMIHKCELHYLGFSIMGSVIELLGAVLDKKDFHKEGVSSARFKAAIRKLEAFKAYRGFIGGKPDLHDLYAHMRSGMAHVVLCGKGVAFTQRTDKVDGVSHLQVKSFSDGTTRLILVSEDLYEDIRKAVVEIRSKKSCKSRLKQEFMNPSL